MGFLTSLFCLIISSPDTIYLNLNQALQIALKRCYSLEARQKVAGLIYQTTTDYLNLLKAQLILDAAHKVLKRAAENLKYATGSDRQLVSTFYRTKSLSLGQN